MFHKAREEARLLAKATWELSTTREQIAKLEVLLEKSLLKDRRDYEKLYLNSFLSLNWRGGEF
jgi:hypothetical protein